MKRFLTLSILLCCLVYAKAERVSYKDAEKAAKSYYYQTVNAFRTTEWNDIVLSCVVNPDDADSKYNLYIFDVNGNEGYVVVSTDNQITPILAYSFDCPFNLDNMSPGQASYIGYYSAANDYAVKNDVEQGFAEANRAEWEYLITFEPYSRATRDVVTSPILLDGIQWSQEWPYNSMCPSVTGGDASYNGHAPVGPTAMAICQIMKYWNWPFTGSGSYTHSSNANGGHGNITVNFGNETYGWYSILDTPSSDENSELGKVCYHVGVALKMSWSADGSGADVSEIPTALKNYFKYSTDVVLAQRTSYTDDEWSTMLKAQIDQKFPMVYSGTSPDLGNNVWTCDGYQINGDVEKFRMEWGWGGTGDGYYTLDNLLPSAMAGMSSFSEEQQAVINIHPDDTFSTCQSTTIIGTSGSFDDGSRAYDYSNGWDCSYTIKSTENGTSECPPYVNLGFSKFNLSDGDIVYIYDGDETSSDIIAIYDNANPPSGTIMSSTDVVTIKFHTDEQNVSDGWRLNYNMSSSNDPYIITAVSSNQNKGSVSGGGNYSCGNTVTLMAIPYDCYRFKEWSDGSTNSTLVVNASRNATYIAYFEFFNGESGEIVSDRVQFCGFDAELSATPVEISEGLWSSSNPEVISFDDPSNYNTTVRCNGEADYPYMIFWTITDGECSETDTISLKFGASPVQNIDTTVNNFVTIGDHTFYSTGNYRFAIPAEIGCDTIVDLQLLVLAEPVYDIGPNPTKSLLNINSDGFISEVEVYSVTGQLVMRKDVNGYEAEFDMEGLVDGVYILRIYGEESNLPSVYKVVKE
ncbi:MAG: C10 family peptidase [Bacteroidales bacterium]|nr:C10 family peptidase [Bacteroidales bacterium]